MDAPKIVVLGNYGGQAYVRADLVDELCADVEGWADSNPDAIALAMQLRQALRDPHNLPDGKPPQQGPPLKGGGVEAERANGGV